MRRLITTIALAAVAVAGSAGSADAGGRPTIRQVWIKAAYSGVMVTEVRVKVARTDHRSPRGVRVCLRTRDINAMTKAELGCRPASRAGVVVFDRADPVTQGLQYQIHHPASRGLRRYTGVWWSANAGL